MPIKEKIEKAIPLMVFFISFLAYLSTMAPSIYWGDSPELASVAYTLGISHSSGYPLYTLLGKFFTFIPIGTIAYRLNLMSAFFASLTVMMLYFVAFKITKSQLAALFSSLTLAFSYTFWTQATIAEVYTLNAFFIVALILIILKWTETNQQHYLYLFSFVFGLGLTNHLTLILTFPAFLLFWLIQKSNNKNKSVISPKMILLMILFFIMGISLYIYLPLRATQNPALNWGNPVNLKLFIEHVSGTGYQHYLTFKHLQLNILKAFASLILQFPLTLAFALLGMVVIFQRHKPTMIFFLLATLLNVTYNLIYDIPDIIVYYIPTFIFFSLFIGIGLWRFISWIKEKFHLSKQPYYLCLAIIFLLIMSNAFLLLTLSKNGKIQESIDRSKFNAADNYAKFMLAYAKPESMIISDSDNAVFPIIYYQITENKRPDLLVLFKGTLATSPWYTEQLKQRYPERQLTIEENENNRSIIFGNPYTLYSVLVNPSFVKDFSPEFIREDVTKRITTTMKK